MQKLSHAFKAFKGFSARELHRWSASARRAGAWSARALSRVGRESVRLLRRLKSSLALARPVAAHLGSAGLDLLAPGFCRECRRALPSGTEALCEGCLDRIEWIGHTCARCGIPVAHPVHTSALRLAAPQGMPPLEAVGELHAPSGELPAPCGSCVGLGLGFDLARAGGAYDGVLRTALLQYKFHRDRSLVPLLKTSLSRAAGYDIIAEALRRAEALVPVPLHPLKRLWRGWDPVLELSREVARDLLPGHPLPVLRLIRKRRWTASQVSLEGEARRRNLKGAFFVPSGAEAPSVVVLLDDVLTTGTTASECALALKRRGAQTVIVLAVARSC